ncbi:MAG: hypothetical protein Q9N32_01900 [Gammaproteobacteria bacterium]|nr:hypothetical protein [Gammaproteobacteria bacterium]
MLGGGENLKLSVGWNTAEVGNGADRFIAAATLAKQLPKCAGNLLRWHGLITV